MPPKKSLSKAQKEAQLLGLAAAVDARKELQSAGLCPVVGAGRRAVRKHDDGDGSTRASTSRDDSPHG